MCSDSRPPTGGRPAADASLDLEILPGRLAVCRLDAGAPLPVWCLSSPFLSITRTAGELSVVCSESEVPRGVRAETGFRALEVSGPLDFALTGILSSLVAPLATARISVLAISTFDSDYVLVREEDLARSAGALREAGHRVADAARPGSVDSL
jgi:hypothetical protein